jgi:prepilin-type N-terminal cleavage/methylation domain-containing protein
MNERGLTLIELIVVILLLGILGAAGAMLLPEALGGYENARAEARLAEEGNLAMTVMAQSIRDAEPSSLAVNGQTVSFALCQPGTTPTAISTCHSGYGFTFSSGALWQTTGGNTSVPLALNASGGFSPTGSAVSMVDIALTLSDPASDTSLTWSRSVAVMSSAYVR